MRIINNLIYLVFLLICLLLGGFFSWSGESAIVKEFAKQTISKTTPEQVFKEDTSITVLVLGCDEDRLPGSKKVIVENARSDTILAIKFDFSTSRITGVSIPRDLMVQLPGYNSNKINAYHKYGGAMLAKKAAEAVMGVPLQYTVVVNYKILQEMVNLVGGVTLDVPKRMRWTDRAGDLYINLNPGVQHLDGYNAMCFVRYRYGDSDYHRQHRQKQFILAFKDAVLSNPVVIPKLLENVKSLFKDVFTCEELASLLLFVSKIGNENIQFGTIPTIEAGNYYLHLNESKKQKVLQEYNFTG